MFDVIDDRGKIVDFKRFLCTCVGASSSALQFSRNLTMSELLQISSSPNLSTGLDAMYSPFRKHAKMDEPRSKLYFSRKYAESESYI